jgi:hypothetical protein
MNKEYCFCTLAIGKSYRDCALLLAKDLEVYAPKTKLIILTDNPQCFEKQSNIRALEHQPLSCKIYNDKRFVIAKALSFYESCIFVDANIRIKGLIPKKINFEPGIVAYSCYSLIKNFYKEGKSDPSHKKYKLRNKMFQLSQQVCSYYNLNLENIKFIFEAIFYVTKNDRFEDFIKHWDTLADCFELNGIYQEEGTVMGLAAAIANFPVNYDYQKKIKIFKDVLEKHKISIGQADYEQNRNYFEDLQKLENPKYSLMQKACKKLNKTIGFYYRLIYLKIRTLKSKKFFSNLSQISVVELKNLRFSNDNFQ